jgi:PAS domain S-box-containing protein
MIVGSLSQLKEVRLRSWPMLFAGLLAIKAVLSVIYGQSPELAAYSTLVYLLLLALASASAVRNAVRDIQGSRPFWVFMALGYGLWALDEWLYLYYTVGLKIDVPDSSIADPTLFLHVVPFMAAMAIRPHLSRSEQKLYPATLNFLLLLFFWIFLYAYVLFPYQYLFLNASIYNPRFDLLYLLENAVLVVVLGVAVFRAQGPWRTIYAHLFGASALYGIASTLANVAIDAGIYHNGSIYGLFQTAAVCWFVWVPLQARQLPQAEETATSPEFSDGRSAALLAMLAVAAIPLLGVWEVFRTDEAWGLRKFRLIVVLISVLLLAVAAFLKEYLAKRDLAADVRVSKLQGKLSELALGASEALQRAILGSLHNQIAVLDRDGIIIDVNESWARARTTGVGTNYFKFCRSPDAGPEARKELAGIRSVMDGLIPRFRHEYRCELPTVHWLAMTVTPLRTPEGGVVISYKDVSEIKRAEARYGDLVEMVHAIVWRADPLTFQMTFVSRQAEQILGHPAESWLKDPGFWKNHIHPEDRDRVLAFIARAVQEKRGNDLEYRVIAADGGTIWLHVVVNVVTENGQVSEVAGVSVDVTERKLAEEARRQKEVELRKTERLAKVGAWQWDPETDTVSWSEELYRIAGLDPKQPAPSYKEHPRLYTTESWERLRQAVEESLRTGAPYELDLEMVRADGGTRWLIGRGEAQRDATGRIVQLRGTVHDITERKRAEDGLRESEERFRLVANTAPVLIWMSGADKLCTYFNKPWLDFTGRPLSDELGNGWAEGVHSEDMQRCLDIYADAFDLRQDFKMEYRLRRYDGEYRWILDIGVPRFNPDRSFAGYIGSCMDVTERKLAEEALSSVSFKLIEAQEQERTRIARDLHDDINQRLALLAIELERVKIDIPESNVDILIRMEELRKHTSEIASDIQALSHQLHSPRLEYLGIVAAMRGFCQEFGEKQKLDIEFRSHDLLRPVPPDISLCLFRVLQEALHNAAKHSRVSRFAVQFWGTPGEIHLTVSDAGVGFDLEHAMRGRGLGLISMQERVRLVNGAICIGSKPGGTTIEVRVPLITQIDSVRAAS